ncbi:YcaO-like family protein [Labrenzia sp. PHM005]|uniref:YcaO-like family protein n=1 Tax=Labrenzia sp. PHM005 TaxID=2590016 RepID=UPI002110AB3A|nr:YcaO-like family protein [Labrenzia sp. PHM005]
MPVLQRFDVRLVPVSIPGCPIHFCTGILKLPKGAWLDECGDIRAIPAGGQGGDKVAAAVGCIGEMTERLCLYSLGESDPRVVLANAAVNEIDPAPLIGFSPSQLVQFTEKRPGLISNCGGCTIAWDKVSDRRVFLTDLSHQKETYLPAYTALFDEPVLNFCGGIGLASTVGCAVWRDLKGARDRALLELIERDAIAQAWYNRLGITRLSEGFLSKKVPVDLLNFLSGRSRAWSVTRVQTDFPVHVVVAVSHVEDGKMAAFGSSANWDLPSALLSALCEMLQAENSLDMMIQAYPETQSTDQTALPKVLRYARTGSIIADWPVEEQVSEDPTSDDETYSYEQMLAALQHKDIKVWEFNATRPDLKVPCIKLFSPELCTWQPRFGKPRLFNGVVERGLRKTPADKAEFAARPFPF